MEEKIKNFLSSLRLCTLGHAAKRVPPKATSNVARISIVETPVDDDKYIAVVGKEKRTVDCESGGGGRKEKTIVFS